MESVQFISSDVAYSLINEGEVVVLDMPYGKFEYVKDFDEDKRKYEDEHLPGALEILKEEFEGRETDLNIFEPAKIEKLLLSKGIDKDSKVLVYSDGIIAATRVAFMLFWAGVVQIYILNGGIQRWKTDGYPIEKGINRANPKKDFGIRIPAHPEILIQTPDDLLEAKKNNPDLVIANVRSWDEFIGKDSGYSYIETTGSPVGSVFAKASTNRINVEYILDDEGHYGDLEDVLSSWSEWGITPDKEVTFLCGAGWRASTVFFVAKSLGFDKVRLYDGGWYQWRKYHELNPSKYPIQKGNPKDNTYTIIDN